MQTRINTTYAEFCSWLMMCKPEVRKNCDGKNCKGEWYAKDIKQIRAGEIPKAEIWTFGFPCTDNTEEIIIPKSDEKAA